jgi:uncharacterized protein YkwD
MSVPAARTPGRVLARTLLLGTGALFAAGLLTWTPSAVSGWNQGAAEGTVWQLLNGARVNNGMAPLQQHGTLIGLARWRSQDMLNRNYFSHTIPGCGCEVYPYFDRNGVNYVWGGENIGWNSGRSEADSPVAVHNAWMNSPGHRANILNAAFTHGGVGGAAANNQLYQGYVQNTRMYTQLFAQAPGGGAAAPKPAAAAPKPAGAKPAAQAGGAAPAKPGTAAPAAPAAPPKPKPAKVEMEAPSRPQSAAVDGTAEEIRRHVVDLATRHLIDERSAARAAALKETAEPKRPDSKFEVAAADTAETTETDFFAGVISSLFGFVFG